ncbi:MAG: TolC family protein [Ignavibacteriaceae bacterium]
MRFLFSLLIVMIISITSFGQNVLTLDQAINIALKRNTTLQKSINSIKSSESNYKASIGALLPSIGANGTWSWSNSVQAGSNFTYGGLVISVPSSTTQTTTYNASIGANWTLFDGLSNIANISQSKDALESAKMQLENLKQNIVFQTITLYYAVADDQQLLKVQEDNVTWNKKSLETIEERNKLGAVTIADVYQQQVQEGNAELSQIQAENNMETAKSNLLYYLGIDVLTNYAYTDTLTDKEHDILNSSISTKFGDLNDLAQSALANRSDYKSAVLDYEAAKSGVTSAEGAYYPSITTSQTGYNLNANRLSDITKSRTFGLGLSLNIPIFNGFSTDNSVEAAEVAEMNKKVDMDDLKRTVKQNLQQTYLAVLAAEKSLDVNKRNVLAADEALRIKQEEYTLGSATLLDVLTANSTDTSAKTNYINSEFQYIVLNAQMKFYLGELDYKSFE